MKLTTEMFIEKSINVHKNKYDYSLAKYINTHTKILIGCPVHGQFTQTPQKHIRGSGCPLCAKANRKQTNLEKYGVEFPLQNKHILEHTQNTKLSKYGVKNPFESEELRRNAQQSSIIKYGMFHQQTDEGKLKRTETIIKKYGVDNVFKSDAIKQRIKETMLSKYNVPFITELNTINIKHLLLDKNWLYDQYITQNKTMTLLAQELDIDNTTICKYLTLAEIELKYRYLYSQKCLHWFKQIATTNNIYIQHATNEGEYKIPGTKYKADGYCAETNTIYEFYGDYWHGNPKTYEPDTMNEVMGKTMGELYQKTIERENVIKSMGYNLIVMWEGDFIL